MRKDHQSGFTLIEVLVAMAIFAFIAVGTSTAVTRSLRVKRMIEKQWRDVHGIRTALMLLNRDIYLAYHNLKTSQRRGFGISDREKWFKTFFIGKHNELNFTSLSYRKLYNNTHESELSEVGYKLTPDAENFDQQNLSRRITPYIDDQADQGGKYLVLLENISQITFRYYNPANDRWLEDWDSSHPDTRNQFPEAVEVTIKTMREEKERTYSTKIVLGSPHNAMGQGGGPGRPGGL